MRRVKELKRMLGPGQQGSYSYSPSVPFDHDFGTINLQSKGFLPSSSNSSTNGTALSDQLSLGTNSSISNVSDTEWTIENYAEAAITETFNWDTFLDDFTGSWTNAENYLWQDNTL